MILLCLLIQISLNSALAKRHSPADFESLSKDPLYIDKTLLIDRYLDLRRDYKYRIITSPPGFMKSTNLDMIKRFVQIEVDDKGEVKAKNQTRNFHLFNNSTFALRNDYTVFYSHLAQYPVVHFELSDVAGPTIPDILIKMSAKIRKCYQDYDWLYKIYQERYPEGAFPKNSSKQRAHLNSMRTIFQSQELPATVIQNSISQLVEIVHYYFNRRVIVLIDDYDAPVIDTAANKNHHTALSLVQNVVEETISSIFKPEMDSRIEYILILGTNSIPLQTKKRTPIFNPFSGEHNFVDDFSINEDELYAKLSELKYDNSSIAAIKAKFGGYKTKRREPVMCRPDSIMRFLKNQSNEIPAADSWIDTGSLSVLSVFLNNTKIRARVEELINGSAIIFELDRPVDIGHYQKLDAIIRGLGDVNDFQENIFFTILFENGYLSCNLSTKSYLAPFWSYKIPNEEALEAFKKFYSLYKQ